MSYKLNHRNLNFKFKKKNIIDKLKILFNKRKAFDELKKIFQELF